MTEPWKTEAYKAQTTKQFAALGRFVQDFEQMVGSVRFHLIMRLSGNSRGEQHFARAVFHHQALSAAPLLEIFRCFVAETLELEGDANSPDERKVTLEVAAHIDRRYRTLVEARNAILHATWFIGWAGSGQTDFSEMKGDKWTPASKGLKRKELPTSDVELTALSQEATAVKSLIDRLAMCVLAPIRFNVLGNFTLEDGVWHPRQTASATPAS